MNEQERLEGIIAACRQGSNDAFSQLVDICASRCYGYFYRLTGNTETSNDLLSELFVKLVGKIGTYRGDGFEKWLFKMASNVFYDYLRVKYQQKKLFKARVEELIAERPPAQSGKQMIDKLQVALDKLPPEIRKLLMLRYYGQLSFKELSEVQGEPIGTTLSKVHRGLKKLRELMGKDDD